MTPPASRSRLTAAAVVLFILLLTSGILAAPAHAGPTPEPAVPIDPAEPPARAEPGPHLVLEEITPWLDEDGVLRVSGTIVNPGETEITGPDLELQMSTARLDSRELINRWPVDPSDHRLLASTANPPDADTGGSAAGGNSAEASVTVPQLPATLPPESSTVFTFEVPAAGLGLRTSDPISAWGARGLAVRFAGQAEGAPEADIATGFTTWYPDPDPDATRITMVMPVTLPGFTASGLISPETLEDAAADAGALGHLLAAAQVDPAIDLALDPRLLRSIETALRDSDSETPEPTSTVPPGTEAPTEAAELLTEPADGTDATPQLRDWFARFTELAEQRSVIALPWADADLVSLRAAGLRDLVAQAQADVALVTDLFPHARADIAWPVSGTVTASNLPAVVGEDTSAVVLSDLQQPALTSYTSDAHSTVHLAHNSGTGGSPATSPGTGTGPGSSPGSGAPAAGSPRILDSLVIDTGLYESAANAGTAPASAAAVSEYVAESSAITNERPYDSRHLLVTLPRTAADDSWRSIAEATRSAPWLVHRSLEELLDTQPVSRAPIVTPTRRTGLPTQGVEQLAEAHEPAAEFSAVHSDPQGARRTVDRTVLACAQAAWADAGNHSECTDRLADEVRALTEGIRPAEGSPVLLVTGERTTIPVRVENSTARPASVAVHLTARTPQLRTQMSEPVVIPPRQSTRVEVPVEGLANGDVETRVEVVAENGYVVPQTGSLLVRVRADWENIGTAVIGAGLLVVFLVGLVKSVSRGRRKIPKSQLDAAMARANQNDPG